MILLSFPFRSCVDAMMAAAWKRGSLRAELNAVVGRMPRIARGMCPVPGPATPLDIDASLTA